MLYIYSPFPKGEFDVMYGLADGLFRTEGLTPVAWVGDKESNYVIMREEDFMANFVGENG